MAKTEITVNGQPTTMGGLRAFVFRRDRTCLEFQRDRMHSCRDKNGKVHMPDDVWALTLEHVPSVHGPADVRRHNERHTVTACYLINVARHSPKEFRAFARAELLKRYPECRA